MLISSTNCAVEQELKFRVIVFRVVVLAESHQSSACRVPSGLSSSGDFYVLC